MEIKKEWFKVGRSPVFEKFMHFKEEDEALFNSQPFVDFREMLLEKALETSQIGAINCYFGSIDKEQIEGKETLSEIFEVPETFIVYAIRNERRSLRLFSEYSHVFYCYAVEQKMKVSDVIEIVDNLSDDDLGFVYKLFDKIGVRKIDTYSTIVQRLCGLYGNQNWKKYYEYLLDLKSRMPYYMCMLDYKLHLEFMLIDCECHLDGDTSKVKWRASIKEINESRIQALIDMAERKNKDVNQKIKSKSGDIKKQFQYSDGTYEIVVPASIGDFVRESEILRLSSFDYEKRAKKTADDSEVLLFVRKSNAPDKPLISFILKNEEIWYIFKSQGIKKTHPAMKFLDGFCEQYNIKPYAGRRREQIDRCC